MNHQTPGPIVAVKHYLHVPALPSPGYEQGACLASIGNVTNREGDARLLAASYTAFDKAGRALGVDAAELAESIDFAELIRAFLLLSGEVTVANEEGRKPRFSLVELEQWRAVEDALSTVARSA